MSTISLVDLASRYWQSMALNAAVQLNLFPTLAAQPMSCTQLAETLDCSEEHLTALAHSLVGLGLLTLNEDLFDLAPEHRSLLDPASPDCMLGALQFNADLAGLWLKLPDCVRDGKPVLPGNPHLGEDPARTRRFVEGMHSRAGLMARALLPLLHPAPNAKVLDVGGGPGTFSLKLAERDPSLHITVLDLPPVVAAAAEIHAGKAALSSITFQGGDYHTADYPQQQDWILYSGALHQEPESGIFALFKKIKAALKPGGTLVVVDLMLDEDRTTPAYSALFQINMMLMRPSSRVYTSSRLVEVLTQTGFSEISVREVPETPYRLVEARI
jgi:ubiquinone/menaquinone biosynthesis C-methylase UbiE